MRECVLTQSRTCQALRLVRDRHKIPAIMSADPVWRKTSWAALEVGQAFRRGPWHTHDDAPTCLPIIIITRTHTGRYRERLRHAIHVAFVLSHACLVHDHQRIHSGQGRQLVGVWRPLSFQNISPVMWSWILIPQASARNLLAPDATPKLWVSPSLAGLSKTQYRQPPNHPMVGGPSAGDNLPLERPGGNANVKLLCILQHYDG